MAVPSGQFKMWPKVKARVLMGLLLKERESVSLICKSLLRSLSLLHLLPRPCQNSH